MRQRRPMADRADLEEGIQKGRPGGLPKVKVMAIEVRTAKENNWKECSECRTK